MLTVRRLSPFGVSETVALRWLSSREIWVDTLVRVTEAMSPSFTFFPVC